MRRFIAILSLLGSDILGWLMQLRRPRVLALVLAVILIGQGLQWLAQHRPSLATAKTWNENVQSSLGEVSSFSFSWIISDRIAKCWYNPLARALDCDNARPMRQTTFGDLEQAHEIACRDVSQSAECLYWDLPLRDRIWEFFATRAWAVREAFPAVWAEGVLTRIIVFGTFGVAVVIAAFLIKNSESLIGVIAPILILPILAGILALALKYLLLALSYATGVILGMGLWIALLAGWTTWAFGVRARSDELDHLLTRIFGAVKSSGDIAGTGGRGI